MPHLLSVTYRDLHARGDIAADAGQNAVLKRLEKLADELTPKTSTGFLDRFKRVTTPRGLYIYGSVGRGKSFLMDLFYAHVPMAAKRRVHFHQFMLEIHDRLNQWRKQEGHGDDPLPQVAAAVAKQTRLLCFDEFHVSDIADAMILSRLFEALFAAGVIVVATSNWAPDDLYKDGLQRSRFLPFIDVLKANMDVIKIDGAHDHRQQRLKGKQTYLTPLSPENSERLASVFDQLTQNAEPAPLTLTVLNRPLVIPRTAGGVAWFTFAELCQQPLGAADFLAIAKCFHTALVDGVPHLGIDRPNETVRFVLFVDALYECKTRLFLTAETPAETLYKAPPGAPIDGAVAFARTASRLAEMQSEEYRAKKHLSG